MIQVELDTVKWAERQFGTCDLGDRRRTRRLMKFAAQVAGNPDGSTPEQTEKWADLKAAYRLIDQDEVTFAAVASPHWEMTKASSAERWLILCDTTEVDFGAGNEAQGLGPLGTGFGRGFLLHSGLMVRPGTNEVRGLAGQVIRYRRPAPKNESNLERLSRDRESQVWGQLFEQIGPPPEGAQFVQVCDRGADDFEVYCRLLLSRHDWVIRASKMGRLVQHEDGELPLKNRLTQLPVAGTYELTYRSHQHGQRTARVEVSFGQVAMPAPKQRSPWLKELGIRLIAMNVVQVREVCPPRGVKPLHWALFTSLPVSTFEEAWTVIGYYEQRSMIEDFHKALKTGCRVEERQYETSGRLEAITAVLGVAAVRLLQLRSVARSAPETPAADLVPGHWITVLASLRKREILTARDFYRQLAGLGGHMLRKGDGEPGWITLWRGFEKLHTAVRAIHDYRKRCG
ncbi:MAG: IS4 family transposase [Pirellulales bacterium]